jgi:serine/threonine protein kinase
MKEGRLTTRCGTPSYCAPELLSGEGYGKAVDMWSVGVLTYVVLTNHLPFVGRDRQDLFARIQTGRYTYPAPEPPNEGERPRSPTSDLARDLISRLLKLEPMGRYSTRETLQHPWLIDEAHGGESGPMDLTDVDPESLGTVHEMMRSFIASQRLKKAFLVVVACGRFARAAAGLWREPDELQPDEEEEEEAPDSDGGAAPAEL